MICLLLFFFKLFIFVYNCLLLKKNAFINLNSCVLLFFLFLCVFGSKLLRHIVYIDWTYDRNYQLPMPWSIVDYWSLIQINRFLKNIFYLLSIFNLKDVSKIKFQYETPTKKYLKSKIRKKRNKYYISNRNINKNYPTNKPTN